MAFKKFTSTGPKVPAMIAIHTNGFLRLSKPVMTEFGLDKANFVVLFYEEETGKIGIAATGSKRDEGAITLTKTVTGAGTFRAVEFLNFVKMDFSKARRFEPTRVDHMLVLGQEIQLEEEEEEDGVAA